MKITYQYSENINEGQAVYNKSDNFFDFISNNIGDSITLLIGYIQLTIDANTNQLVRVWGPHPYRLWKEHSLDVPKAKKGIVIIENDYEASIAYREPEMQGWKTYYDQKSGWVCVGDPKIKETAIMFATDIFVVIKDNEIKALWIKPKFVDKDFYRKTMKISYQYSETINEGQPTYDKTRDYFDFISNRRMGNLAVLIGNMKLTVDESTHRLIDIWGTSAHSLWKRKSLVVPKAKQGIVTIENEDHSPLNHQELEINASKTYYDEQSGWVCIGDDAIKETAIMFATDIFVVIKDEEIKALWIKPKFINKNDYKEKMQVSYQYSKAINQGWLTYDESESYFCFHSSRHSGEAGIRIDHLNLTVEAANKQLIDVEGTSRYRMWKQKRLDVPKAQKGIVIIENYLSPMAFQEAEMQEWETYYDKKRGWICIGDCEIKETAIMFAANIFVVIKDKEIKALWLKPRFINRKWFHFASPAEGR